MDLNSLVIAFKVNGLYIPITTNSVRLDFFFKKLLADISYTKEVHCAVPPCAQLVKKREEKQTIIRDQE